MPVKYYKDENQIELIVYGNPVAQGRPRFSRQGGFVKAYDPIQSKSYKQLIRLELQPLLSDPDFTPIDRACCLKLTVFRAMPKSFSKKKREEASLGYIRPTTKPDTDNYVKGVLDALNGTVLKDDSVVCEIFARKFYNERPRIEVVLEAKIC
jgi:Holliday junction resolvase RusA-like endonuclease|nr:MAG TPA: Endodeoxyribonuclease RusA [Caudoviricetes sp.]